MSAGRLTVKNLTRPDERMEAPRVTADLVNVGGLTISRDIHQPGWRWTTHVRPVVGTEHCEVDHLGVILRGQLHVELADGTAYELGPWDVMQIPPGHDAWVVGEEEVETLAWRGARTWLEPMAAMTERVLATLLITDIVESTVVASRLGDRAWGELLGTHDEIVRQWLARYRGRLIKLTGDGVLATFDSPGRAVRCAVELRAALVATGLAIRAALTTGEIEIAGDDIRGLTIHEASRMLAQAAPGEILLASSTRDLARDLTIEMVDRGELALRGLDGSFHVYAITTLAP